MKLKSFCMAKDTIIQTKQQPTEWREIFVNYTPDRGLISTLYKEPKQLGIKKKNNSILKWGTDLDLILKRENSNG